MDGESDTNEKNLKKYKNALRIAYEDGVIIQEEKDFLELKKKKLNVTDEQQIRLELEVLLELGRQALDRNRLEEAIDFIEKVIEKGDADLEVHELHACLLVLDGEYEKSKASIAKCEELADTQEAPADEEDAGPSCPDCGTSIRHIEQYDRYYCDACKKYLAKDFKPGEKKEEPKPEPEPEPEPEPKPEPEPTPEAAAEPTCPDCSGKIRHIEQYGRYYCDACKKYLPKDFKPEEKKEEAKPEPEPEPEPTTEAAAEPACPDCSGKIRHIEQYGRYYCDACKKYMPKDFKPEAAKEEEPKPAESGPEPAKEEPAAEPTCPDCAGKIRHIEQYGRYYCDACKKYMPKDFKPGAAKEEAKPAEPSPEPAKEEPAAEPTCPDCSGKIRHIAQYDRHYCDACKKYMPKDFKPGGGAPAAAAPAAAAATPQPEQKKEPACPDCSGKIRHIAQYGRWYCDACKKYMPTGFSA